jgi:aspartokinase-like uncharacterized kinase
MVTAPIVIKLGGSLLTDPEDGRLRRWCEWLTGEAAGRCAVVPGGGPFADAVRAAQPGWRFSDETAHRMALRAMEQFGLMLCGLFPDFVAADTLDELAAQCGSGRTPVWLPSKRLDLSREIPRNWTVTSDSLAVWLAGQLGSRRALLVKSCAIDHGATLTEQAAAGIVDPHLPRMASATRVQVTLVHADGPRPLD